MRSNTLNPEPPRYLQLFPRRNLMKKILFVALLVAVLAVAFLSMQNVYAEMFGVEQEGALNLRCGLGLSPQVVDAQWDGKKYVTMDNVVVDKGETLPCLATVKSNGFVFQFPFSELTLRPDGLMTIFLLQEYRLIQQ